MTALGPFNIVRFLLVLILSGAFQSCNSPLWWDLETITTASPAMEGTIDEGETVFVKRTSDIQRNDIVAFYYQVDKDRVSLLFRVAGVPGDKVEIRSGQLYINGENAYEPENVKYSYIVKAKPNVSYMLINEYECSWLENIGFYCNLSNNEVKELAANNNVHEIEKNIIGPGATDIKGANRRKFEAFIDKHKWNIDNVGPFTIPPQSDNQELYFVLGDNRHNAFDSRYIGFVKKSDIIGVVLQ